MTPAEIQEARRLIGPDYLCVPDAAAMIGRGRGLILWAIRHGFLLPYLQHGQVTVSKIDFVDWWDHSATDPLLATVAVATWVPEKCLPQWPARHIVNQRIWALQIERFSKQQRDATNARFRRVADLTPDERAGLLRGDLHRCWAPGRSPVFALDVTRKPIRLLPSDVENWLQMDTPNDDRMWVATAALDRWRSRYPAEAPVALRTSSDEKENAAPKKKATLALQPARRRFKEWRQSQEPGYIPTRPEDWKFCQGQNIAWATMIILRKESPTRARGSKKVR